MRKTISRLASSQIVALLSRAVAALGLGLASGAIWIFLDTREQQKEQYERLANELRGINVNMSDMKMGIAVGDVKINEVRERVKKIEDKVFQ